MGRGGGGDSCERKGEVKNQLTGMHSDMVTHFSTRSVGYVMSPILDSDVALLHV